MSFAEPIPLPVRTFQPPPLERAQGSVRIALHADGGLTRISENYQSGSAKARFPRTPAGAPVELVLINTSGGVTGGDQLDYAVSVGPGARGIATTQAAERIYRRRDGVAHIENRLTVGAGATLDWLPQETILFDRSALRRTLDADVDATGRLLAVETVVLGRAAMGERVRDVRLADSWRIRRDGHMVFADGLRIDGDGVAVMAGGATGAGAAAVATLLHVAPDAEAGLDLARASLAPAASECGASAWRGILVARLIAPDAQTLRGDLTRLIEALRRTTMPRVWNC